MKTVYLNMRDRREEPSEADLHDAFVRLPTPYRDVYTVRTYLDYYAVRLIAMGDEPFTADDAEQLLNDVRMARRADSARMRKALRETGLQTPRQAEQEPPEPAYVTVDDLAEVLCDYHREHGPGEFCVGRALNRIRVMVKERFNTRNQTEA